MARILIADDNADIRAGVRALLSRKPDCEVCGEAKNGREAIEKVQQLTPDLIVLDVSMPIMSGVEAASEIRRIAPATKIIFFTMYDDSQTETAAWQAGADAVVKKSEAAISLMPAVERLSNGHGRG